VSKAATPGALVVVGTPIGNLEDMTPRAVRALREADLVAAEDTRTTRKLFARFDLHTPLVSFHRHNLRQRLPKLLEEIRNGKTVAVVSDAGMPGISDPGEEIVHACLAAGLPVAAVPGPTAVITALVLSGLPTARFTFLGFLPSPRARRRRALREIADRPETLVLYEAPHRLVNLLEDMVATLGPERRAAAAAELTKVHERVIRGTVSELLARFRAVEERGEFTLVVEGATGSSLPAPEPAAEDAVAHALRLVAEGMSVRDAVREAAGEGVSRRELYARVLAARAEQATSPPGE